ncbi:hypothetical protein MLD38_000405 [Melastoma candidum]|uniref:Uncharacterized protein n=1 Tax=Melastoma candidum TaxID=119954 RepID=A0ACB9SAE4_9MYRT|nr:hypothetical protein MLD38_000405 [Melastoma candidum]
MILLAHSKWTSSRVTAPDTITDTEFIARAEMIKLGNSLPSSTAPIHLIIDCAKGSALVGLFEQAPSRTGVRVNTAAMNWTPIRGLRRLSGKPFSSSSSSLQTLDKIPSSLSPFHRLLPSADDPNNLVPLLRSSLAHTNKCPDGLALLRDSIPSILPHLGDREISMVLLRCQSDYTSALAFFNWVRDDLGLALSSRNYGLAVHVLVWSQQFSQAMNLLTELISSSRDEDVFDVLISCREGCNWDPAAFDLLVKAYLKLGMAKRGYSTFRKMANLGFAPSVISCNFLLDKLLKVKEVDRCWRVYELMGKVGVRPNAHTFNILMNLLCKEGDVGRMNEFMDKMDDEGFEPDIVTYNTLMYSYCRQGRMEDAFRLYNIMYRRRVVPDLVSHTSLINGLCRVGKVKEAHKLFHQMVCRGLTPDRVTYETLILGYCREGMMQEPRVLVHEMLGRGICPGENIYRSIVKGHVERGWLVSALNTVVELQKLGSSLPHDLYEYLITCLCQENRPFAAKNFLDRILAEGYVPTLQVYGKLVESLCKDNLVAKALVLKLEMSKMDLKPDLSIYKALINSLCRQGRSEEGESLLNEMVEMKILPDGDICRVLVNAYIEQTNIERAESVLRFFSTEFRIFDSPSYNLLIRASGDVAEIMAIQERMVKIGFMPSRGLCKHIIDVICQSAIGRKGKSLWTGSPVEAS